MPDPEARVDFAPVDERLRVRVVVDPLPTVMTSVVELFGPLRSRTPPQLRQRAAALARGLDLAPLLAVLADPFGVGAPDFTCRLERDANVTTVHDAVELLRGEPRETVHQDIETFASYSTAAAQTATSWQKDDRKALARLGDAVWTYWHGVLRHLQPDLEDRLLQAANRLCGVIDELGPTTASAGLHPRLRVDLAAVSSFHRDRPCPCPRPDAPYRVDTLLIKPIIASRRTILSNLGFPLTRAAVACPTPALIATAAPAPPRNGLDLLVGASRARILRQLRERPTTTTQLAQTLGLAPSTVSHHLSALAAAGAVHPLRHGPEVHYLLTDRGLRLLDI